MKILFINPIIDLDFFYKKNNCNDPSYLNLGILYLASIALKKNHQVMVKVIHSSMVKKVIKKFNPDLVCISCMTPQYSESKKIATIIKKIDPNIKTFLGGYLPTNKYDYILKESSVFDYLFLGEGEITFEKVLDKIKNKKSIKDIKGLAWKENSIIKTTGEGELVKNLDSLIFPARQLVDFKIPEIVISRGCKYNCKFCSIKEFYKRTYRLRSVDNVIKEIKKLSALDYKMIKISDDNFGLNKEWLNEFTNKLVKNKLNKLEYQLLTDIKNLNSEGISDFISKVNVKRIMTGIQTVNEKNARAFGLRHDNASIRKLFKKFEFKNVKLELYYILNLGGMNETIEDMRNDANKFYKLISEYKNTKIGIGSILILELFPGIEINKEFEKAKIKASKDWILYQATSCNYEMKNYSSKELNDFKLEFRKKFAKYYPPTEKKLFKQSGIAYLITIIRAKLSFKTRIKILSFVILNKLFTSKDNPTIIKQMLIRFF